MTPAAGGKGKLAREDSITYLALEFKDEETEARSIPSVWRSVPRWRLPDEEVEGRFILPHTSK